jgi:hypothetical protein
MKYFSHALILCRNRQENDLSLRASYIVNFLWLWRAIWVHIYWFLLIYARLFMNVFI